MSQFVRVRALTTALAMPLSDADASAQSMPDASPAKWHLAHTTWFFESFVLQEFVSGYVPYDTAFSYLFNSYYEGKGERIARHMRGLLTRPSLEEVLQYREHVDAAIVAAAASMSNEVMELVKLGCNHEQQHQELLITDVLHLFYQNPLLPAAYSTEPLNNEGRPQPMAWVKIDGGMKVLGHGGEGFSFDCERPRHSVWLPPYLLADRLVTNHEWLAFINSGGYEKSEYWLSDGWAWVQQNQIRAPLYWIYSEGEGWPHRFGLAGPEKLALTAPVSHICFYEADAYARWAGARLPTEAEWENAAAGYVPEQGVFLDDALSVRPMPASAGDGLKQLFGDLWEWTGSAFLPHPGFRPEAGAVGEYNGKFMSGQFVLKGGSCATPRNHIRASYRNFFYPHQRWQFTGVRLAKDI
ncbi:ergothioneine biosynthesis protein EgtB [Duganella callida]|nr:ergothioneine biosynthesis protein EgtB [Duganella callida]